MFCYLVSHAYAWQNLPARAALLDSLRGLQDSSRLDLFRPFLLSGIKSEDAQGEEVSAETADLYAQTLLDAYATVPKGGWDENAFSTLMALLESQNLSGMCRFSPATYSSQVLELTRSVLFVAFAYSHRKCPPQAQP